MTDARLFRTATGYATTIRLERNGTWSLTIDRFYEGEAWSIDDRSVYADLSLREATDVLLCEVFSART